ncbi:DUF1801 domain-containing protein [Hydrogenophaga flava]|uniref:DUF1801 domain-containing protein n=1 Tax=Hydrogenophaga flava TaxID=65657 RepID=UPI0008246236|nr:DUF1801 domain-containing protein [Hydrogenophaga flava]
MNPPRVQTLLNDIRFTSEAHFLLVSRLRELIQKTVPGATDEVKYGGFLFSADVPFCGVFAYSAHVSLEFGHGAAMPDPHKVLQGSGKLRRHIKLGSVDDISAMHVAFYLPLALEAARGA